MAAVYYNFDSINVDLKGTSENDKHLSIAATQSTPSTNIQYNDVPYFINNISFYKDSGANKDYLVVETTTDTNSPGKCVFFAIPLKTSTDPSMKKTDIDKLFEGTGAITINLSGCVNDGDSATMYIASNEWPTIVVTTEYNVKSSFAPDKVVKDIKHLTLSGASSKLTIRKQIFGWNMNCTLMGEDEAGGEVNMPTIRVNTMDTTVLIVTLLLVVSAFYVSVPIIYKYYIIPIAQTRPNLPLASIDIYWTTICVLTILSLTTYGLKSQQPSYYFVAFTVGLILFICKKWIRENIGNIYSKNTAEINVDFAANPDISSPPPGIEPGYFAVYTTSEGGMNYKAIIFVFITLSIYMGSSVSSLSGASSDSKFSGFIMSFLGMAIFTTAMFMEKINWKIVIGAIVFSTMIAAPMIIMHVLELVTSKIAK